MKMVFFIDEVFYTVNSEPSSHEMKKILLFVDWHMLVSI